MFCPKCAAQNVDDAKYCRACGTDISLVPQAITGHLAERLATEERELEGRKHRHGAKEPASIERAVKSFFMGVAFICVAFAARTWAPAGAVWWFWLLIPAIAMIGDGVASYLRLKEDQKRLAPPTFVPAQSSLPNRQRAAELSESRHTGELLQPPSVTEATTQHLAMPVESKQKDL